MSEAGCVTCDGDSGFVLFVGDGRFNYLNPVCRRHGDEYRPGLFPP
jgi:hypothetical protein